MATKKTTSDTKGLAEIFNLGKFFDNSNIKFILGIILFFFSVYMMFAFVSFLYTGENDMSILESTVPDLSDKIQNKCGPFGANMAYFFIKSYFGYAAFFIPALICAISLTLVEAFILNIWKWFLSTMLLMLWLSIALAKFAAPFCPDLIFNPGGVHGDEIVRSTSISPSSTAMFLAIDSENITPSCITTPQWRRHHLRSYSLILRSAIEIEPDKTG